MQPASVHVADGRILRVAAYADTDAGADAPNDIVDAGELAVLPGLVDTHVHVNEPGRTHWEGFRSATRAAAAGGVTTLLDMPLNSIPATTTAAALDEKQRAASGNCHVDVGFIGGVVPGNEARLAPLWEAGVLAYKCFLVPSGVPEFEYARAADLECALPVLARLDAPLMVHAELPEPIAEATAVTVGDPRRYATYLATRPAAAETAAIRMLVDLAQRHGARVHIVHVSAAESLEVIASARRAGVRITAETCPHYLTFVAAEIADGATELKCAPPIREASNREALWRGLRDGTLDCVVSDHSPAPPELKLAANDSSVDDGEGSGDFLRAWGGIASLELTLAAVWTGMRARGLDAALLAQCMSEAPARLAGLQDTKGRIIEGGDADLALVDLDDSFEVEPRRLHQRHKLTPYAGRRLFGRVAATYLRGELVYANGAVVGEPRGRLLRRV